MRRRKEEEENKKGKEDINSDELTNRAGDPGRCHPQVGHGQRS